MHTFSRNQIAGESLKQISKLGPQDFEFLMDLQLAINGVDFSRKRTKWLVVAAALGFSGYGVYRLYHLPSVSQKRKRILKLLGALVSVAEVVSDSAESIGVVSKDLKDFLKSDSDKIPNSLKQLSKIARCDEFSESVVTVTQAVTLGVLRGYGLKTTSDGDGGDSSFTDQVMDKLFTKAGSGFASVVVGNFARNVVLAFYSDGKSGGGSNSNNSSSMDDYVTEMDDVPRWVDVVSSEKFRDLIGDCIQLFVSTAVAVYLDKTMGINTYDDIFSGLTNSKHETKVRDMLSSVCNGAVETLIRTSHQVLTDSTSNANPSKSNSSSYLAIDEGSTPTRDEGLRQQALSLHSKARNVENERNNSGWVGKVSNTLAVPSNRRFVLDVTGRVTSETVRSFLEFLLDRLNDGMKKCVNSVREETVDRGLEVVRYAAGKSSVIATISLSLCLHILDSPWALVPS